MLKFWLVLLLLLNAAVLAWQWDAFATWGVGPNTAREPERMQQQVRPDGLKIETPATAEKRMAAERAAAAQTAASEAAADPAPTKP